MMDSAIVLKVLERERALLQEFMYLSQDQVLFMEDRNVEAMSLFEHRADLMIELTAIDATLDTWINQIRTDPAVTPEMMYELRTVSDEIVSMANHIIEIDEQIHACLDVLKERARTKLQEIEPGV